MAYQVAVFRLGNENFAADIASIKEIVRLARISRLPHMPADVEGVINLRGVITTIVDLRKRLGVAVTEQTKDSRVVVLGSEINQVGAIVDDVSETLSIEEESIDTSTNSAMTVDADYVTGVARAESGLIILLDLARILFGDYSVKDEAGVTEAQKNLVQSTFAKVETIADDAAKLFYSRLFELDPEIEPLFKNADMTEQRKKLMQTIAVAVKGLDNLHEVAPAIEQLGIRHNDYGVKVEYYDTVGAALLWALEQGLGSDFTPEVEAAWTSVYCLVSSVMMGAAKSTRVEEAAVTA